MWLRSKAWQDRNQQYTGQKRKEENNPWPLLDLHSQILALSRIFKPLLERLECPEQTLYVMAVQKFKPGHSMDNHSMTEQNWNEFCIKAQSSPFWHFLNPEAFGAVAMLQLDPLGVTFGYCG